MGITGAHVAQVPVRRVVLRGLRQAQVSSRVRPLMTAAGLRQALFAEGVRTVNLSGTHWLDPGDLRSALARREACE